MRSRSCSRKGLKQGKRRWRAQITKKHRSKKKVCHDGDNTSATGYHSTNLIALIPNMLTESLAAGYLTRYCKVKIAVGWMTVGDALDTMTKMERWSIDYMKRIDIDQFDTAEFEYATQILLRPLVDEISAATGSMKFVSGS